MGGLFLERYCSLQSGPYLLRPLAMHVVLVDQHVADQKPKDAGGEAYAVKAYRRSQAMLFAGYCGDDG